MQRNFISFLVCMGVLSSLLLLVGNPKIYNDLTVYKIPFEEFSVVATIYGQEEDEEEEDSEDKEAKDEDEDSESKEQDEEESESDTEQQQKTTTEEQTTAPTITTYYDPIPAPDPNLPVQEQQQQTPEEIQQPIPESAITTIETPPPPPPSPPQTEEDPCNCTNITSPTSFIPTIQPMELEQIVLKDNIEKYEANGGITDPKYTGFYNVPKAFDNTINNYSYWSQESDSSFTVDLKRPLENYDVCSVEVDTFKPENVPFEITLGHDISDMKTFNGTLDREAKQIVLDSCIQNIDQISMIFDSNEKFTSIAELKLFGKKLYDLEPPQQEPTTDQSQQGNITRIDIVNSKAEINIKDSTIDFKFDPNTSKFVNQGN
jgi:hypothetical protein